jgi:hypothetical protein
MTTAQQDNFPQGFVLRPGDGWLFYQVGREDTFIFQGHLKFHDGEKGEAQIVARLDTKAGEYDCEVREFGTWKTIAAFKMPSIGKNPFVEAVIKMPLDKPEEIDTPEGKLSVTHRKYKVRAFRDSKRKNVLRMQLPEVMKTNQGVDTNAPEVPM